MSSKQKLNNLVKEFGGEILSTDGTVLFCKVCEKTVNYEKKYFVTQHLETSKHKAAATRNTGEKKACLISTYSAAASSRQNQFSVDLCKAFIDADIPLWKLENKLLKCFLEMYTKEHVPSESTLRKNYVDPCYTQILQKIKDDLREKKIWISIDETTDAVGRYVANVIVGSMDASKPSKVYLLTTEVLDKANSTTIAQLFTKALALLWPDGIRHENVLLFLTDAAPYMKKAARALKVLFPAMLHLTCLAHALHRISEQVRGLFPDVDLLVSNGKKIFLKAPSRVEIFKDIAPNLALPPQPVLTRWGTWISAAIYYATNFDAVTEIINHLDEEDASSIRIVKQLLLKDSIRNDLAFIAAQYSNLPNAITSLEKRDETLVTSLKVFCDVVEEINSAPGVKGRSVREKYERVISSNQDLPKIKTIAKILEGESAEIDMNPIFWRVLSMLQSPQLRWRDHFLS